jgi:cell wall-associated NlpC family hydrolase
MHADYLTWTDEAVTPRETGTGGGNAGSDPGSADGQELVSYAMNYLGYKYVWATHGPKTFDCSGFTYWVTLNTIGQDIGTGTWTQSVSGTPVAYGDLQPGDLVFFQNTYTWGLSHVGIYIGNNQFIHAENEDTGVVISSLTSQYYSSRWYGARRIT